MDGITNWAFLSFDIINANAKHVENYTSIFYCSLNLNIV